MPLATSEIILIVFVLGLPIVVVAGVGYLLMSYFNKRNLAETKQCPSCAERIQLAAKVCRYCQRDVV